MSFLFALFGVAMSIDSSPHACREGCGACCIAPSISSPIPGMPEGKRAGERCIQLGDDLRCGIFGDPRRPACCGGLQPSAEMCGETREYALVWIERLEAQTQPTQLS
ncbi:YkgJ family cysteine cluster protein [Caballeronia sp. NK8]|nr:YkgJ family cysteine cluster protein [Caballeronia sp. NK8]